jgi:hypothetical protein
MIFSDSGGNLRQENTLTSPKVSLFPAIAATRHILRFVVYFGPKDEEDLLGGHIPLTGRHPIP